MAAILNKKFHDDHINKIDLVYRLNRRASEVKKVIEEHFDKSDYSKLDCLDVGTADGLMLSRLNNTFKFNKAIGIDMSEELIKTNEDKNIKLEVCDAENLRFGDDSFDVIVACAVIEHVDNPNKLLSECHRVLKKNGILIITTPNPFHDSFATKIGYLKEENHIETFSLKRLQEMFKANDFKVISLRHFMFFPFFRLPLENQIESFIRFIRCGKIMSNQIIVGKK